MLNLNSLAFLPFMALVAAAYYLLPPRYQNILLLLCSLGFYFSFSLQGGLFLLLSTAAYYPIALLAGRRDRWSAPALAAGMLLGLGSLVWVKYLGLLLGMFGVESSGSAFQPLGISFYTFQSLGYITDVYKGERPAERNVLRHALFISFFPSLLSGPICSAGDMLPQYASPRAYDRENLRAGSARFLLGLFKKAVVADGVAVFVDGIFRDFGYFSSAALALALASFALQLYFDFSGYSDMAIGAARVLGIELRENFRSPYFAASYREFWSRWHISLTGWFRKYLYLPLGGSRKGRARKWLNIMIVFAVSGLWHGAAATFLVWGLIQGVLRILDELVPAPRPGFSPLNLLRTGAVLVCWSGSLAFFRAPSISDALQYLSRCFAMAPGDLGNEIYRIVGGSLGGGPGFIKGYCLLLALSAALCFALELVPGRRGEPVSPLLDLHPAARYALGMFMAAMLLCFGAFGSSNFIYFNF